MIKFKYFVFIAVMTATLLFLGNAVKSAEATNARIIGATPTPTVTSINATDVPGESPSAEEQEELKTIVQSYIDTRYRALSISNAEDFKQNGFDSQMSEPSEMT